ncbi:MAG: MBL fold metallo-hydrolase [Betaproteobacteria bacterium]|nr:MBL fold metallo-hydrolase [Betaproteobacteria bacterium]
MTATTPEPAAPAPAPAAPRPPRAAASLVVIRDAPVGLEVLLLLRAERGDHNSSAWVFPGGIVDTGDRHSHHLTEGDDAAVSVQLGVGEGGLDYQVAALRECFEECGLLFAVGPGGEPIPPAAVAELQSWRGPLHRGERTLVEFCEHGRLRLGVDQFAYLSHWLTPAGRPKRFDTRFFIAAAPAGQVVAHDETEIVAHQWLRPAVALAQVDTMRLMTPTRATLQALAQFDSATAAMAWARGQRNVPRIQPRLAIGAQGVRPVTPDEYAYAEIGRLDPQGRGDACYDIQPGVAVRLSPRLIRVTANNGSVMTGPGTNTYLIGGGPRNEWAVVDPGPHDASHVEDVLAAAPGAIRWIFATHTHIDHSPATVMLQARTGAAVHGRIAAHPERQDHTFAPERILEDGERIALNDETTLRAIHTPGHASNHLCYLLEEEKTLLTGDHVMQSSTVVINPPDGDMTAYIASLRALARDLGDALEWLAPGHGFLMDGPKEAFERIVRHRLKREAKVVSALGTLGALGASPSTLLGMVYDDVPQRMHPVALRSLLAHLHKLRDDGVACEEEGRWALAAGVAASA